MKLDRNINQHGLGKYALVLNRKVEELRDNEVSVMLNRLIELGVVDMGTEPDTEFFVLRLKDKHAAAALFAYVESAWESDKEWASEVEGLAFKAREHANPKQPD